MFRSDRWQGLRRAFRLAVRGGRRSIQAEIGEELRFHLEERIEELMSQGLPRGQAEREARARFGDLQQVGRQMERIDQRTARRQARGEAWRTFARDLRFGFRALGRHPGFAAAAVLTLGLGMGATGSIYTLLQRVVLDPLPYPSAGRLVRIKNPVPGVESGGEWNLSTAQYFHYRQQVPELDAIGLYDQAGLNLAAGSEEPKRAHAAVVTASMMGLLGARAVRGRLLNASDDSPAAPAVAVLAYRFWRSALGGSESVVGSSIQLNDEPTTVIGVMAPGIELPRDRGETVTEHTDIWLASRLNPAGPFYSSHVFRVIARLASGADLAGAQRRVDQLQAGLPQAFPSAYSERFFARYGFHTVLHPLKRYVLGDMARNLWILFGAVGLVLLIACANVAGLLLARLTSRRRELAVRSAIGARRSDIAREAFAEGLILTLAGAGVALLVSLGSVRFLLALAPPGIPRLDVVAVDGHALLFILGLSLAIAAALAAVTAAHYGSGLAGLGEAGRAGGAGPRRQRLRSALVVTQIALALMLVVGSGLLLRSFRRLRAVDPGIDSRGVLTVDWYLPQPRYDSLTKVWRFHAALLEKIRAIPGVTAAGGSEELPFLSGFGCTVQGFEEPAVYDRIKNAGLTTCAGQAPTTPGYFEALRIPLLAGRYFSDADNTAPERGAVIVTKAFAERFWPGENPLGKGVSPNGRSKPPFYHVVGVVADLHGSAVDEPPVMGIFYPVVAMPGGGRWYPSAMHAVIRTTRDDPRILLAAVRGAVNEVDPSIPIANAEAMQTLVNRSMGRLSFVLLLLGTAGGLALGLAAIGLYGLISYVVARRTNEIGVRLALGARPREVEGLVVRGALRLAMLGLALGLAGAAVSARVLGGLLYGIAPWDPAAYAASVAVLLGVAGVAAWIPGRKAARIDPVRALRQE
jgi:putative ABC transport system permease protein